MRCRTEDFEDFEEKILKILKRRFLFLVYVRMIKREGSKGIV